MAPCVIGFLETNRTSLGWHGPQEIGAARRSPGFMKRTKATSSLSSATYERSGLPAVLKTLLSFGCTCTFVSSSVGQFQIEEQVVQLLALRTAAGDTADRRVDLVEAAAWQEARGAQRQDDVLVELRPVDETRADVDADRFRDVRLEEQ